MWVQAEVKRGFGPRWELLQEPLWVLEGVSCWGYCRSWQSESQSGQKHREAPIWIPHERINLAFDLRMGELLPPEPARHWLLSWGNWLGSHSSTQEARAYFLGWQESRGLGLWCHLLQKAEPLKQQHGELGLLTQGQGLGGRAVPVPLCPHVSCLGPAGPSLPVPPHSVLRHQGPSGSRDPKLGRGGFLHPYTRGPCPFGQIRGRGHKRWCRWPWCECWWQCPGWMSSWWPPLSDSHIMGSRMPFTMLPSKTQSRLWHCHPHAGCRQAASCRTLQWGQAGLGYKRTQFQAAGWGLWRGSCLGW